MTPSEDRKMRALDAFLEDARNTPQDIPPALMERVLMDAARLQPVPERPAPRKVSLSSLLAGIGGWPALGGLAAASCVGFWFGINPSDALFDPASLFLPAGTEAYYDPAELTGFGWDVQEG